MYAGIKKVCKMEFLVISLEKRQNLYVYVQGMENQKKDWLE